LTRFPELKKIRASLTEAEKEFRTPNKLSSTKNFSKTNLHNEDATQNLKTIHQEDVEKEEDKPQRTPSKLSGNTRTRNNE
jgi:hypothetical protein